MYLSAILAGSISSMHITDLPLCVVVVTHRPSADPAALSISTSRGPVAFSTSSEKIIIELINDLIPNMLKLFCLKKCVISQSTC